MLIKNSTNLRHIIIIGVGGLNVGIAASVLSGIRIPLIFATPSSFSFSMLPLMLLTFYLVGRIHSRSHRQRKGVKSAHGSTFKHDEVEERIKRFTCLGLYA